MNAEEQRKANERWFVSSSNKLLEKWLKWNRANPDFWPMFNRFANNAAAVGRTRFSGWLIVNRIRWETNVVQRSTDDYKISNDYIAIFTRLYAKVHPQHEYLFKFKPMKSVSGADFDQLWKDMGL